jgi:GNAT superfamily N-acetyltransferase
MSLVNTLESASTARWPPWLASAYGSRDASRSARFACAPDHRGKGYAAFLVAWLVHELRGQGVTPFLHVFTDNVSAIALRAALRLTVLSGASDA